MKKSIMAVSFLLVLCAGCASMSTEFSTTDPKTGVVNLKKTKVSSFFAKSAITGLESGKETKTGSSLISVKSAGTESETEKLAALFEAVTAGAVKGATIAK